jgi:hypothetical protein
MRKGLLNGDPESKDKCQIPNFKFQMKPKWQRGKIFFETWKLGIRLTFGFRNS